MIKKRISFIQFIIIICLFVQSGWSQSFNINISKDTIFAGNVLTISFLIKDIDGTFEAPDMSTLKIVQGPSTSKSITIMNGKKSQEMTYSYGIFCDKIGEIILGPAYVSTSNKTFETEPHTVIVLPNPDGIIEQESPERIESFIFGGRTKSMTPPQQSKKKIKKRKLKKL